MVTEKKFSSKWVEYCFSICYFNVTKLYLEKQAVSQYLKIFHCIANKKRLRMHNWDTVLESHGRLDKTVYGPSRVQVSH